jgi:recombination protein RecT
MRGVANFRQHHDAASRHAAWRRYAARRTSAFRYATHQIWKEKVNMAEPSTDLTTTGQQQQLPEVVVFRRELETRATEIQAALPSHISAEKFQRTVTTAVMQNPDLLKADRRSLLLACMKAAQDGLLPDGREAALVTFSNRVKDPDSGRWVSKKLVQFMPMVFGLRKKILQARNPEDGTPLVVALEVGVVYRSEWEGGFFRYEVGTEPPLQHRVRLDLTPEEATDENIVAAYSIATMANGLKSYEVMRRIEIDKVRQCSQTGAVGRTVQFGDKQGEPIPPKGPWVDWFPEMAKKTVVRRHSKTLPMSGDVLLEHGTEAAEFEAATSAGTLLGSTAPDAPQLVATTDDLPPHDTETGELHEEGEGEPGNQSGAGAAQPEASNATAPAASPTPAATTATAAPEPSAGGNASANGATAQSSAPATPTESGTPPSGNGQNATTAASPSEAAAPTAEEAEADRISAELKAAENIIDLEAAYDRNEDSINELDGETRSGLLGLYAQCRRNLGARTTAPAQ